jgi:hypothetical protein
MLTRAALASLLYTTPERFRTSSCVMAMMEPTDKRATPWRLQQQQKEEVDVDHGVDDSAPAEYQEVIRLLREADRSGRWPPTSRAREKVLKVADPLTGGSISLRNVGMDAESRRGTRGNLEFPELARAIFELEKQIAPGRPPSTMVAVNRRAAFVPHTAPGAGLGNSTCLIVGLGNYTGGALLIDGTARDVRYDPLEFDGYGQEHATAPFEGEQFSLVWFSPAPKENGKPYGATLDPQYMTGKVRFSIPGFDDA